MKNQNLTKLVSNVISRAAIKTAIDSEDSACWWFQYQPKTPKSLKKVVKSK